MRTWAEKEIELAHENEDDFYSSGCYQSALKAYKSLLEDGHSGMSIMLTKQILNRLIDGKPLTALSGEDDEWDYFKYSMDEDGVIVSQNKRYTSLFKYVDLKGTVKYKDIDRVRCYNLNHPNAAFSSGLISKVIDEMYPIEMPYYPEDKPIEAYCYEFLFDEKNGDFDTVAIKHINKPSLIEPLIVNRYFKEVDGEWREIYYSEYMSRLENRIR
jgi:hypothetical protein